MLHGPVRLGAGRIGLAWLGEARQYKEDRMPQNNRSFISMKRSIVQSIADYIADKEGAPPRPKPKLPRITWVCRYCKQSNFTGNLNCKGCGASQEE